MLLESKLMAMVKGLKAPPTQGISLYVLYPF